jgi:hypothetical protein
VFAELTSSREPPPPEPVVDEPEEDFAPAATEMRKRLAASGSQSNIILSDSDSPSTTAAQAKVKSKKRPAPDEDEVIAAAKERKRVALEQTRREAEELAEAVKDHAHLKNLGEVELFHVDMNVRPSARENRSTRWDPAWNGRKNFKKFRKAKQSVSIGVGRQVIQLVDFKGKSAADSQGTLTHFMMLILISFSLRRDEGVGFRRRIVLLRMSSRRRMIWRLKQVRQHQLDEVRTLVEETGRNPLRGVREWIYS